MQTVLTQSDSRQTSKALELEDKFPQCDFPGCRKPARLTIDTPNRKDVPVCDERFKKINWIAQALQESKGGLTVENLYSLQRGRPPATRTQLQSRDASPK